MKNTREVTKGLRIAHWTGVMQSRSSSGLSIKSYCEREGIHTNVYFYWQRKLRGLAVTSMQTNESEIAQLPPPGWAEISEPSDESEKAERNMLTIEIGKCRVPVNDCTDADLLAKVCKVLVELC